MGPSILLFLSPPVSMIRASLPGNQESWPRDCKPPPLAGNPSCCALTTTLAMASVPLKPRANQNSPTSGAFASGSSAFLAISPESPNFTYSAFSYRPAYLLWRRESHRGGDVSALTVASFTLCPKKADLGLRFEITVEFVRSVESSGPVD